MAEEKIVCSVCGADCTAEYEQEGKEKLKGWALRNPSKVRCEACYGKAAKAGLKPTASKKEIEKKEAQKTFSKIDAKKLRKAYDEVRAEFADVLDEVKEFIGGWTTTIALSDK